METMIQNAWTKGKVMVKALIIGLLVLVLLIPTIYVQNLIEEREARQKEATTEVSSKWAGRQIVTGPVLVLPYWDAADTTHVRVKHYASFLPDELKINGTLVPQEKYRGIYKVMLYTSRLNLSGNFKDVQPEKIKIRKEDILWNEAFVKLNLSDVKGLNDEINLRWNNTLLPLSLNAQDDPSDHESFSTPLNLTKAEDLDNASFSTDLNISGSEQLQFTPVGKSTTVTLNSQWPHPSFSGDILPQTTNVSSKGFSATWKSLALKRNFPQQWKDDSYPIAPAGNTNPVALPNSITNTSFGADLFVPVNGYQKTTRSIKYAVLCILLTFAAFFLIETTNKRSVHPFQYGLIGLALIMFYTLLLSFSEYIGFNLAYAIASVCTIGLIAWFVKGILGSFRLSSILSAVLLLIYTYVFTILQLQDYSLILGSVGLFITLAIIMHFSKKIQW
jgi:inner membrane protein